MENERKSKPVFYAVCNERKKEIGITDRATLLQSYAGSPKIVEALLQGREQFQITLNNKQGETVNRVRFATLPEKLVREMIRDMQASGAEPTPMSAAEASEAFNQILANEARN